LYPQLFSSRKETAFARTQRTQSEFEFASHFSHQVVANFDGGTHSSDAGLRLLREAASKLKIFPRLAQCFTDFRSQDRCEHGVEEMLAERVLSLAEQALQPPALYEQLYCVRGKMENRIKEQLSLFADRVSAAAMRANQFRLYLPAMAYRLIENRRRRALKGTELARAQATTIRLRLLKIGAEWKLSARGRSAPPRGSSHFDSRDDEKRWFLV